MSNLKWQYFIHSLCINNIHLKKQNIQIQYNLTISYNVRVNRNGISHSQQYKRVVEEQGNVNPFYEEVGLVARAYCDMSTKYPCSIYE
ncbi:Endonuclease_I [Hexamita inflata]|uniref:Endonuclease_I n=1 Tax=Hexamita inflata TaxID=28002 RepID=A0ABP1HUL4_9EUKA